jgi:hypothetical protein
MDFHGCIKKSALVGVVGITLLFAGTAFAADSIKGQVLGGNAPIAKSTVTLWEASADAPKQISQTKTTADGRFQLSTAGVRGSSIPYKGQRSGTTAPTWMHTDAILYLVAMGGESNASKAGGDNPAIALITVLGENIPHNVVINEMTTVASVWTNAQFLNNTTLKGQRLSLHIAAGNVPNFVDVETGGWGEAIQGPLNSGQTPTMANFASLADVLSGCVTRVKADACSSLFAASTPPGGGAPTNTLNAAEAIALNPWYQPERVYNLLRQFYEVSTANHMLAVPFMPYLNWAPSAWVLPLKFDGGGYRAGGKAMFDSEGNLWVGDNFTIGWQEQDSLWQGPATKFAPNGKPLSPITTGFTGGGMEGGTFGAAVDAKDNAWFTTYGSKSISVFDKNGKPLTPPEGINFGGQLGLMQGIIVTPSGDVWVLGVEKSQLVFFPNGDISKGKIICEGKSAEPCKSFTAPFHLGIDQQDRIWVANSGVDHVTRFPASDPTKVENFKTGLNNSGLGIDSLGNVWVTNRFGTGVLGMAHLIDMGVHLKAEGVTSAADYLTKTMSQQQGGTMNGGSVTMLRPDGAQFPGSPFKSGGLPGPWAVAVDGNDNIWISNFASAESPITVLCGARTQHCPPGKHTGDQISPPLGYVGGGLQMLTDIAVDPAGNVWAMNNWQDIDACIGTPKETLSTRCGGQGVVIFYGLAKPVRAPQIGPAKAF